MDIPDLHCPKCGNILALHSDLSTGFVTNRRYTCPEDDTNWIEMFQPEEGYYIAKSRWQVPARKIGYRKALR